MINKKSNLEQQIVKHCAPVLAGMKIANLFRYQAETENHFQKEMDEYTSVAFGCPAMGDEELEETEFLPVYEECEAKLAGKRIGLFGSYEWGDGKWMRTWEENCKNAGAIMVDDPVICVESPDEDAVEKCRELGAALV